MKPLFLILLLLLFSIPSQAEVIVNIDVTIKSQQFVTIPQGSKLTFEFANTFTSISYYDTSLKAEVTAKITSIQNAPTPWELKVTIIFNKPLIISNSIHVIHIRGVIQ